MSLFAVVLKFSHIPERDASKDDTLPSFVKLHNKALHINTDRSGAK